jgi:hypothetical protein
MRRVLLVVWCAVALAGSAAGDASDRVKAILMSSVTPADLRARLLAWITDVPAADSSGSGDAWHYVALSYERGGVADSAAMAYRRAWGILGNREDLIGHVDAMLVEERPEDGRAVIPMLRQALAELPNVPPTVRALIQGRLAWAEFIAGKPDSAVATFAPVADLLGRRMEWSYRMARAKLAAGDAAGAVRLALPVAAASRTTDLEVMGVLRESAKRAGASHDAIDMGVRQLVLQSDQKANALLTRWGDATRSQIVASDSFPLGVVSLPPRARKSRPVGVVVMMAPGDSLPLYDSLAVALRRHGLHVLMVEPRGSGLSVGRWCPLPEAWDGREEEVQHRVARDARDAWRTFARSSRLDTTRYVVVGSQRSATMAVEAAAVDRRVRALLLAGPTPVEVDRGAMRARLAALQLPVFFQIAPEEYGATYEITDQLYQAGNRAASRVVEAKTAGRGVAQFRGDTTLVTRFTGWLDDLLAKPATPPAPRRKG